MKIVLFGGTDLALRIAETLVKLGMPLACVFHVAREFAISYSPGHLTNRRFADIAGWAEDQGIEAHEYESVDRTIAVLQRMRPRIGIAAGWYHMLPAPLRRVFARGVLGIHASMLPRYRGGAPLNWALLQGEQESGVSLFELADGVDNGPLYGQRRFPIGPRDYIGDLVERANDAAVDLLRASIGGIVDGSIEPRPQVGAPTYCLQRNPDDGAIDWTRSADEIERLVRAVSHPYPGARAELAGTKLNIWRARCVQSAPRVLGRPGQIARLPEFTSPCVVTGQGLLAIEEAAGEDGADLLPRIKQSAQQHFTPVHV